MKSNHKGICFAILGITYSFSNLELFYRNFQDPNEFNNLYRNFLKLLENF